MTDHPRREWILAKRDMARKREWKTFDGALPRRRLWDIPSKVEK